MGRYGHVSLFHPDHLIRPAERLQPVRDQQDNRILLHRPYIGKNLSLRRAVNRRKRIIQHHHRAAVKQGSRKCDTGLLTSRKAHAAVTNPGVQSLRECADLLIEADGADVRKDLSLFSEPDIFFDRIAEKLRILPP